MANDNDIIDEDGQNLLHRAIARRNTELCLELIDRGINIDHCDNSGFSALHFCAVYRNVEVASALIKKGANVNARDVHENNPLWTAVFNARGDYDLVKVLLAAGADPFTTNKHGKSPFDFARQIGSSKMIELLDIVGS